MGLGPIHLKKEFQEVVDYFIGFAKNPVQKIRQVPDWPWSTIIGIQVIFGILSGIIGSLFDTSLLSLINGVLVLPLSAVITTLVGAAFFYYIFVFFFTTFVEFKKLATIVVLANLPFLLFHTVKAIIPPIDLIGLAFSCVLLIVGFVDGFKLDRKKIIRVMGAVYLIFFAVWVANMISQTTATQEIRQMATPESLDVLQKELDESFDK